MVYIKRVVIADITRQIGLNQEVSDSFFRFNPDTNCERYLKFTNARNKYVYTGTIKKTGHSITITGELYAFIKDNCQYGDIVVFSHSTGLNEFKFLTARKDSSLYNECDQLLQRFGTRNNTISRTTHLLTEDRCIEALF